MLSLQSMAVDIHVSTAGNDGYPGTSAQPLATLQAAVRKARDIRRTHGSPLQEPLRILLHDGRYLLTETLVIRPEDGGTETSPLIILAQPGSRPILSGGVKITDWKLVTSPPAGIPVASQGQLWVADIPAGFSDPTVIRQLWIDGRKAIRTRHRDADSMDRILRWDKRTASCIIPTPRNLKTSQIRGMEFLIHQWWEIALLRVRMAVSMGDSTRLYFHEPESRVQNDHPWPAPWISTETGNSAFLLLNAAAFLNTPGEWWADPVTRKIYYRSRPGEHMTRSTAYIPQLESLIDIRGTIDRPLQHIRIIGISFEHTAWTRPARFGHVPHQNGLYMTEAYRLRPAGTTEKPGLDNQAWIGRPPGALNIEHASDIQITGCQFRHLAATGIDLRRGVRNTTIEGNLLKDIAGNGLLAGYYQEDGDEILRPWQPKDDREVPARMTIRNNLVTDVANEDWGCVGIGVGYARETSILHNEVENVSYSAITMGWGWSPGPNIMRDNLIALNRIHHFGRRNYDCAGIYTLSAQPGTRIEWNVIDSMVRAPYAHLPSHWFWLYTDEGSSGITVTHNRTPTLKYLQNNNGPGTIWTANGPDVPGHLVATAGLEPGWQHLLSERTAAEARLPLTWDHPEVVELVFPDSLQPDIKAVRRFMASQSLDTSALFVWKNRVVIFTLIPDLLILQGRLRNAFPGVDVRLYHDLFYAFRRDTHCDSGYTSPLWEDIILTADLVADPVAQQRYLDYHARQFTDWPEVSAGFCRAGFQQLLLFRNGRQLMLVIRIPKGKTLAEIDPLTTKDNPRMDEWNRIMRGFQTGIKGTAPGETWVFLNRIPSTN